jgi:hypothetical protein
MMSLYGCEPRDIGELIRVASASGSMGKLIPNYFVTQMEVTTETGTPSPRQGQSAPRSSPNFAYRSMRKSR